MLTWMDEGATLVDDLVATIVPRVDKKVFEKEKEIVLLFIVTTTKSQAIQSISDTF